jgi:NAD(P)-dependent dehydrogenase (short-subunit alcohol dehydrogenase family)
MTGRAQDRMIMVTGAAGGQGSAEVRALHEDGGVVIAADIADTFPGDAPERVHRPRLDARPERGKLWRIGCGRSRPTTMTVSMRGDRRAVTPAAFEYLTPETCEEALAALADSRSSHFAPRRSRRRSWQWVDRLSHRRRRRHERSGSRGPRMHAALERNVMPNLVRTLKFGPEHTASGLLGLRAAK